MIPERYHAAVSLDEELLPATRNVERALLGAVLTLGAIPKSPPRPEDFSSEAHRVTWAAILSIASRGDEPSLTLLDYELSRAGRLERAGGPVYLASHLDSTDCSDLDVYARIVKEAARMRQLKKLST